MPRPESHSGGREMEKWNTPWGLYRTERPQETPLLPAAEAMVQVVKRFYGLPERTACYLVEDSLRKNGDRRFPREAYVAAKGLQKYGDKFEVFRPPKLIPYRDPVLSPDFDPAMLVPIVTQKDVLFLGSWNDYGWCVTPDLYAMRKGRSTKALVFPGGHARYPWEFPNRELEEEARSVELIFNSGLQTSFTIPNLHENIVSVRYPLVIDQVTMENGKPVRRIVDVAETLVNCGEGSSSTYLFDDPVNLGSSTVKGDDPKPFSLFPYGRHEHRAQMLGGPLPITERLIMEHLRI